MPIIRVTKQVEFSAAHSVLDEPLHGHNYKLSVTVQGPLNEGGILIDFRELKEILREVLKDLDHRNLNDILPNPTAERVALFLWKRLAEILREKREDLRIVSLKLWENDTSWVELVEPF